MQNKYSSFCYNQETFYSAECFSKPEHSTRILMIGDVVGRCGRRAVKTLLPKLKQHFKIDFVTLNAENMAGGFGITEKTYVEMNAFGIDAFTMGNHWQDKPDVHKLWQKYPNIVLPQNLPGVEGVEKIPSFLCASSNKTIHVLNLMGTFAMKVQYKPPFEILQAQQERLMQAKQNGDIIIADIHAEGCAEKQSIGWFSDGLCAAIIGTHTHVPTSDERILTKGTAFLTDVGMTGAYESVTGMLKERIIERMCYPDKKRAFEVSESEPWFCGFMIDVSAKTSLATSCFRLQCRMNDARTSENWFISWVSN